MIRFHPYPVERKRCCRMTPAWHQSSGCARGLHWSVSGTQNSPGQLGHQLLCPEIVVENVRNIDFDIDKTVWSLKSIWNQKTGSLTIGQAYDPIKYYHYH